jgi:peptidoglycan/LPS O-acetylase OafA/YrhL
MVPLGTRIRSVNMSVGAAGMAIFFVLSGLLITRSLLKDAHVRPFIIKRLFRIVPLVYVLLVIIIAPQRPGWNYIIANGCFFANSSESTLTLAPHLWSLSVEMQFYAFAAGMTALFGQKWLKLRIVGTLVLLVTASRVWNQHTTGVHTFDRVDEILAGVCLAIALDSGRLQALRRTPGWAIAVLLVLLLACTDEWVQRTIPALSYARPYIAAAMVGASLFCAGGSMTTFLSLPVLKYFARISFALYVIHGVSYMGWMGTGDLIVRYTKRAVALIGSIALADASTRHFDGPISTFGHRLAAQLTARSAGHGT